MEHLLEWNGNGDLMGAPDFRRCRICGSWFMSDEFSEDPCQKCRSEPGARRPPFGLADGAASRFREPPTESAEAQESMARPIAVRTTCPKCGQTSAIWTEKTGYQNEFCPFCGDRLRKNQDAEAGATGRPRRRFKLGIVRDKEGE
jgi:endogenous inhibitor of DNA gyrase (YacG/DUF329 family)